MAKTTKTKDEVINTSIADLVGAISKDIKKDFEVGRRTEELGFLSTGNPGINYAISGKFDGGFPQGRITELYGLNSTGKSLLALHSLVETQRKNGLAILIDSEFAYNPKWFRNLGGIPETLIHFEPDHIDEVYAFIKTTTEAARKRDQTVPITIVYDSVAASPSKAEYEGAEYDMGKRALAHGKGIRMLMGLCAKHNVTFVAINQLRQQIGVMYGPDKDTVGGMGWKYATSVRINMKKGKKITAKTEVGEQNVGIFGSIVVEKNRLRSPFATADFSIYFDQGIDPVSGLFDVLVGESVVTPRKNDEGGVSKGWWTYKDMHFQKTNFSKVLEKYPELLGGHELIAGHENAQIEDFEGGEGTLEDADGNASSEADM